MEIQDLLENAIIILDKWQGPTSRDVTATVKKILGAKLAGHSGTLDPMVSGVLPIALNNATKIMPALQHLDKEYVGIMRLHKDVSGNDLNNAVKKFIGRIKQMPPVRSAVARKERERTVYFFDVLEKDGRNVLFKTKVEAGTYIRVICHQIGGMLGGAHMAELRRTKVGGFSEKQAVKIHDLADAYAEFKETKNSTNLEKFILPVETAIQHLPKMEIKDSAVFSVLHGSPLYLQAVKKTDKFDKDGLVAIMNQKKLLALGTANVDNIKEKGIIMKIDRVIAKTK
ncbi:MAG: RNA-guided pseudouridylation complex pseudouridine synthase subunit Cbf5 [Candidatus Aenigmarchaeota archaeon]|nr:RNA-guided pseudouridylation complex pseudouridine synthase subunit Cbf5 [Candidatus Aenigmarchaeota archaeon]